MRAIAHAEVLLYARFERFDILTVYAILYSENVAPQNFPYIKNERTPTNMPTTQGDDASERVTCRICHATYIPSFLRDFYPDGDDPSVGRCESCLLSRALAPKDPVPIDKSQLESLCKLGAEGTCSFLVFDRCFACAKGSSLEAVIRERREAGTMRAKGDNCQGAPEYRPMTA